MNTIPIKFLFIIFISYLITGCTNKNDTDAGNTNYESVSNNDSANSTGNQAQDSADGKIKQQNQGHGNSTAAVKNSPRGASGDTTQSETNPQKNPDAMQKANSAVSGVGESGHIPANTSHAPAYDPNNKAKTDTSHYK